MSALPRPSVPDPIYRLRHASNGWKFLAAIGLAIFFAPQAALLCTIGWFVVGPFGVLAGFTLYVFFLGWLLVAPEPGVERPSPTELEGSEVTSTHCRRCGARAPRGTVHCPACNGPVEQRSASVHVLAAMLDEVDDALLTGLIDVAAHQRLTAHFETMVASRRPQAPAPAPAPVEAPHPAPAEQAYGPWGHAPAARPAHVEPTPGRATADIPRHPEPAAPRPAAPPPPPAVPPPTLGDRARAVSGWAAERQADILLYAGAFLLSVSALIFVAYQGSALNGQVRFGILTAYAAGFLVLGLTLSRWERVREAGPVFLAVGAILVPVDFLALRTQVLTHEEVPNDVLWLFGSTTTAVLYFVLALRRYGRLYAIPATAASIVAWGSLASVLGLPWRWFPAWYELPAGAGYVLAEWRRGQPLAVRLGRWLALGIGALALIDVHGLAFEAGRGAYLPAAELLPAVALAAGLRFRRQAWALAVLPPLVAAGAGTTAWAITDDAANWTALFVALCGAGYLVVAHFDRPELARAWGVAAAAFLVAAIAGAHGTAFETRATLPATYGIAFLAASVAYARWRWTAAAAVMPPLLTMAALTEAWAGPGLGVEWYGSVAVAGAAGYLLLAHFDPGRKQSWQPAAALAIAGGLALAWATSSVDGVNRYALPASHAIALALAVASTARWRLEWRVAVASLPALAATTAATFAWARFDLAPEWYPCFAVAGAAGCLLIAHFDSALSARWQAAAVAIALPALATAWPLGVIRDADRLALPAAHAIVLAAAAAATARWRFGWRVAPGSLPTLGALTAATYAWAEFDVAPEWLGLIAAPAALGYVLVALLDAPPWLRTWLALAAVAGTAVLVTAHGGQLVDGATRGPLAAAYAVVLAANVVAAARWRFAAPGVFGTLSPLAAATGAATCWAAFDMRPDWLPAWCAAAALGYIVTSTAHQPKSTVWRVAWGWTTFVAIVWAHGTALPPGAPAWVLPATYGIIFASSLVEARRLEPSLFLAPVFASLLGASTLWAAGIDEAWWPYPALGIAALFAVAAPWWPESNALRRHGWPFAIAIAAAPTLIFLPVTIDDPSHGLAQQLVSAALIAFAAFRTGGAIGRGWFESERPAVERTLLLQVAFAFVFGAAASANDLLGVEGGERAAAFIALGVTGWLLLAASGRRTAWQWTFLPLGLAGNVVAATVASSYPGWLTAVLAAGAAGPALAFVTTRRWTLLGVASAFTSLALAAFWGWRDLPREALPFAFALLAAAQWLALTKLRRAALPGDESSVVVLVLSWGSWIAAAAVAGITLGQRQAELAASEPLVTTADWGFTAAVVAMASAAVLAEGFRLGFRWLWMPGYAGLVAALLMAIATREPENVQAYCAPIGVALIVAGLTWRRTPPLFGPNLQLHEALMLVGAGFLLFPPAAQSFDPGGGKFGLEIIGISIGLLLTGLGLHARWLVPAALLALTATAVRLLTTGETRLPYWLLLGLAGTLLIGLGVLLLLQRARWDRFRAAAVAWWEQSKPGAPPPAAPVAHA